MARKARQKGFFFNGDKRSKKMKAASMPSQKRKPGMLYAMVVLLVILLGFVAVTLFLLTRESRNEKEWGRLATDVQVLSQQMTKSALEAAAGSMPAFVDLGNARGQIESAMLALKVGDAGRSLPRPPSAITGQIQELDDRWQRMSENVSKILEREILVSQLSSTSEGFRKAMPGIQAETDKAVRELTKSDAPSQQIFVAGRQLMFADRLLRHLNEVHQGGTASVAAAENFSKEVGYFEQLLNGLLRGSSSLGVSQVSNATALNSLRKVQNAFNSAKRDIEIILTSSGDLIEVRGAADEILADSQEVFERARIVSVALQTHADTRLWPSLWAGVLPLILILAIMAYLVRDFLSEERNRAMSAGMQNQKNQRAILQLLDEMSSLADGDLTVKATVTDNVTGSIADSVNYAVERLRELVTGINITAQTVSESAQTTMETTSQLAEASTRQAEQVRAVTETIDQMSRSFDDMANRSRQSSEVARRSVEIANNGSDMVQQSIQGMGTIREQIQDTSKRIKRLGESSQEIGDIVELINGIAEQTNILALNAAIQSASAGGAGRGFAVVADEVQRLAERATNATRRIETLVKTIQADTSEAVVSMEATTTEVVNGAKTAEDAGEALIRIESVSKDLSSLIEGISQDAQAQSETATSVAEQMNAIRDVSIQTSEGTNQTARSMDNLAELVKKLRESVADFKLPAPRVPKTSRDSDARKKGTGVKV
jgi:twitching motility protein PilJ